MCPVYVAARSVHLTLARLSLSPSPAPSPRQPCLPLSPQSPCLGYTCTMIVQSPQMTPARPGPFCSLSLSRSLCLSFCLFLSSLSSLLALSLQLSLSLSRFPFACMAVEEDAASSSSFCLLFQINRSTGAVSGYLSANGHLHCRVTLQALTPLSEPRWPR